MTPICRHCANWRRRNLIFGTCYETEPKTTAERETCAHYSDRLANRAEFESVTPRPVEPPR